MQNTINSVLQNPSARALILIVLIIPLSVYLGTSPVRRGFLYYSGLFAPSVVAAIVTIVVAVVVTIMVAVSRPSLSWSLRPCCHSRWGRRCRSH